MSLYLVRFDDMPTYVEAPTFSEAIALWDVHMAKEQGADWDGNEQPEEVVLVHDEAVVRRRL